MNLVSIACEHRWDSGRGCLKLPQHWGWDIIYIVFWRKTPSLIRASMPVREQGMGPQCLGSNLLTGPWPSRWVNETCFPGAMVWTMTLWGGQNRYICLTSGVLFHTRSTTESLTLALQRPRLDYDPLRGRRYICLTSTVFTHFVGASVLERLFCSVLHFAPVFGDLHNKVELRQFWV